MYYLIKYKSFLIDFFILLQYLSQIIDSFDSLDYLLFLYLIIYNILQTKE